MINHVFTTSLRRFGELQRSCFCSSLFNNSLSSIIFLKIYHFSIFVKSIYILNTLVTAGCRIRRFVFRFTNFHKVVVRRPVASFRRIVRTCADSFSSSSLAYSSRTGHPCIGRKLESRFEYILEKKMKLKINKYKYMGVK